MIFEKERRILKEARALLDCDALEQTVLRQRFGQLVDDYKKNLGQSERLVVISDRQQLKLVELNEIKDKFLGIAAHDLSNPLTVIMGYSRFILDGPNIDPADQAEFIDRIYKASVRMHSLLTDLLDVSAIETGHFSMTPVKDDVTNLIKERTQFIELTAEQKNIRVETKLDVVPQFEFDAERLGQVVDNLLSNAIKFSQQNTVVSVAVDADNGWVRILVADQGPGIPSDEIGSLFDAFQKTSVRPTGDETSTGLGLAIVKKIVAAHGGRITVESEVGKGTRFIVSLPCGD